MKEQGKGEQEEEEEEEDIYTVAKMTEVHSFIFCINVAASLLVMVVHYFELSV